MKIAQIAPMAERVPPEKYGGTERVVHALTEELVNRGHEVTLFASGDSITTANLESVFPRSLRAARVKDVYGANMWTLLNIGWAYHRQGEFDIIHDHTGYYGLPAANIATTPVVITNHGPYNHEVRRIFQMLNNPHLVSISNAQAAVAPYLNFIGNVYNGLPMEDYPFEETSEDYLLFVGRISLEKGVHLAIQAALFLNKPLIIAAKLDSVDRSYYHEYVEPYLSDRIRWIGEVGEEERNRLMSKALCFLHPVTWREPFGLTLIEAMACGCPVVAINRGSIPEIIVDGKTGYVVNDLEEMLDAIERVATIDRRQCRTHALENFSAKKMADGYEAIYTTIINQRSA